AGGRTAPLQGARARVHRCLGQGHDGDVALSRARSPDPTRSSRRLRVYAARPQLARAARAAGRLGGPTQRRAQPPCPIGAVTSTGLPPAISAIGFANPPRRSVVALVG